MKIYSCDNGFYSFACRIEIIVFILPKQNQELVLELADSESNRAEQHCIFVQKHHDALAAKSSEAKQQIEAIVQQRDQEFDTLNKKIERLAIENNSLMLEMTSLRQQLENARSSELSCKHERQIERDRLVEQCNWLNDSNQVKQSQIDGLKGEKHRMLQEFSDLNAKHEIALASMNSYIETNAGLTRFFIFISTHILFLTEIITS